MKTLDELHGKMDLLATNQMNLCSAIDLLWQSQNALVAELKRETEQGMHGLELLSTKLEAGLKGITDGTGLALAELRKELLGTPQRGHKHSYRGKRRKS